MELMDITGLLAAFCTTISFLPQAIKTIRTRETRAISLSAYVVLNVGILLWLVYGLHKQDVPLVAANGITFLFTAVILFMKIRHK